MDRIEPRIHDEIKDYKEKFYSFTIRQWLFAILIVITVVPIYIFLNPILGSDLTGWIVIIIALPLGFFGFIPIQGLNAEKIIFFWKRNYINFAKPIYYKTEEDKRLEKEQKKKKPKISKQQKIEVKKKLKEEKQKQRQLKIERQRQRDLARARKKFGTELPKKEDAYSLSSEETKALLKFVEQAMRKENNPVEEKGKESGTQEEKEKKNSVS